MAALSCAVLQLRLAGALLRVKMKTITTGKRSTPSLDSVLSKNGNGDRRIQEEVQLPEIRMERVEITVVGKSPLIVHNWSSKAVRMMLDKQLKVPSKGREKRDPFEEFVSSLYPVPNTDPQQYGMSAPAFKACAVSAANAVDLKMTQMRQAFHVNTYTVPVIGKPIKEPLTEWDSEYAKQLKPYHDLGWSMRMDVVRLDSGVADLRFRAWCPEWSATLEVEYNPSMISLPQLVNLFRSGGLGCGIGEWRPSSPKCRSGEYGRFDVK